MRKKLMTIKPSNLFIYICILLFVVATMSFLNLKLIPIDGLLQTYNSTRRINLGEIPYRDFTPYLGLGPIYVNFLGAKLLGGTLVAQFIFVNMLHLLIGIFILHVLFGIFFPIEKRKKYLLPTVILLTGIYLLGLHFPYKSIFFILGEYTRPGNSALGLRVMILFLTVYVCLKIENARYLFFGYLVIGLSLVWSVDYAFVTFIVGSLILGFPRKLTFLKILKNTATNIIISGGIGYLLIIIFTRNNFNLWFSANYLTQRDFQYWYFGIDENFVYGIDSIPYLLAFAASTLMATMFLLLNFNKSNFTKFLTITATTSIGMLSQLNSAPSPRYLVFALLANIFGSLSLWSSIKDEGLQFKYLNIKLLIQFDMKQKAESFKLLFIRDLIIRNIKIVIATFVISILGVNLAIAKSYVDKNIYVHNLGGYVDPRLMDSVQSGEKLAKSKSSKILTTYSGVTSIVAGKMNATKTDYIIHAFTKDERRSWIDALEDPITQTVITTRTDVLKWEPWIARANWWFYSELLKYFEITKIGTYEIYWSRKTLEFKDSMDLDNIECLINVIDDSKAYISIIPVGTDLADTKKDQIVSIELTYKSWSFDSKPLSRNRVTVTAMNELVNLDVRKPNTFLNVGAPEKSNSYLTYLKFSNLSSNQLLIKSSPELNSKLKIYECSIKASYDYASLFPKLPASRVSFDEIISDFRR